MDNKGNFMDYIRLEKIPSYKNIINVVEDIHRSYFFRGYNFDINDYKNIIEEKNRSILRSFNKIENKILEELLKYGRYKEYDKEFLKNTELESKLKVLNYMYWQYKLIDTSIKIDLTNLKRVLYIKNDTKYIEPIEIHTKCNLCYTKASIFILSYNKKEDILFKCYNCSHSEIIYKKNVFPIQCKCEVCRHLNKKFFDSIKTNFEELLQGIQYQVKEFYENSNDELYLIDDEEMEIDCKLNRGSFDKDVREVMSYKPKNIQELIIIINKLNDRNNKYCNNYKAKIYKKLDDLKIIYFITIKEKLEIVKYNALSVFVREQRGKDNENCIFNILSFLKQCEDLYEFEHCVKYWNSNILVFNINNKCLEFFLNGNMQCGSSYNPVYKITMIFNKFYSKYDNLSKINSKTHILNVFKSEAEKSLYIDLLNRYSKVIIIPNCKADSIINIITIKNLLLEEQYEYLRKCYFDFVILDLEGNPIKVIELQRGSHHNKKEWKEKDLIKQELCNVAGIEFEEIF